MSKKNYLLLTLFLTLIFVLRLGTYARPHFISGQKIKITATLREEPKIVGQTQHLTLAGVKIKTFRYPEFHYGDHLEVIGTVKKGNEIEKVEQIRIKDEEREIRRALLILRQKTESLYRQFLPEPQASLLAGIVLGSKSGMPKDFYEGLRKTGTLHMVVASGMNVAIVGSTLLSLFLLFLSRRRAIIFSFLGIWFYVMLAGAEIPVVRAGIMGSLAFLAQGLGRQEDAWRGLFLAAVFFILLDPLCLSDIGFQLSFAATGGILFFGSRMNSFLKRVPVTFRSDLSQALGAQIATLPLLLYHFGQYSFFSLPTNLLLVTFLSLVMKLGAVVGIFGLIFSPFGQIAAWFLWPLLTYFVKVVELFSGIKF